MQEMANEINTQNNIGNIFKNLQAGDLFLGGKSLMTDTLSSVKYC